MISFEPALKCGKFACAARLLCAHEPLACSGTLASAANICGERQFAATNAPVHEKGWRFKTLLLLSVLAVVLTACDAGKNPGLARPGQSTPPLRKVKTVGVTERRIERTIIALGSLMAHEQATLSAKVPGRMQAIQVDLGSVVRSGDVVARIEPRDYQLKVQQAAAALAQARAVLGLPAESDQDKVDPETVSTVKEARAVLDEAQANLDRLKRLSKEKIISQSEVDSAQSAYLVALNRCQDAQEKVRQQQALVAQRRVEFEIAKQQLADTTIVAPFEGGIQQRQANIGEYLTVGSPVVTLVRLNPLRLRLEVSERDALKVRLGQKVRLTVEGDTNTYTGEIQRLSPALTEQTRMLVAESDIENDGRLHPGYFIRAEIVTVPESTALTIPTNAVVTFAGLEKAFTIQDGKAVEKRITTRDQAQDWVEVVSGLVRDDRVIMNPGNLQTGHPIVVDSSTQ
jgi:RND family efflux transporter MFP subunit